QHTMLALQAVRPGNDPIHQTAQALKAHRSSLPGHRRALQAELGAAGRAVRCQTPAFSPMVAAGFRTASAVSQRGRPEHARSGFGSMVLLESWWWAKQPARVPRARTAGLLAGLGAALFGVSAVLLKTGTLGWDESLSRLLNEVPAAAASVLTPLSRLFLPAGIITVVALIIVYVLARNRSILPVVAGAAGGRGARALGPQ